MIIEAEQEQHKQPDHVRLHAMQPTGICLPSGLVSSAWYRGALQSYKCFFLPSASFTSQLLLITEAEVMQAVAETVAVVDSFVTGKDTRLCSYKQRGTRDRSAEGHPLISTPLARLTFVALWWRALQEASPVSHVQAVRVRRRWAQRRPPIQIALHTPLRRRKHLLQISQILRTRPEQACAGVVRVPACFVSFARRGDRDRVRHLCSYPACTIDPYALLHAARAVVLLEELPCICVCKSDVGRIEKFLFSVSKRTKTTSADL